jgi:hypothetical protein
VGGEKQDGGIKLKDFINQKEKYSAKRWTG